MANPDRNPGGGVLLKSSLSRDRILRAVQLSVARRTGRPIIQDEVPSSSGGEHKLNGVPVHERNKS